jgi:uncharacterized membrane protein YccC
LLRTAAVPDMTGIADYSRTRAASPRFSRTLKDTIAASREPLLFGVRLWASVCLALFVAFWLELDNPFWAGTSAAVVCQPQLGASLRKGRFRMIGTAVGATAIVVLTACFPQDRIAFFVLLALWGSLCAFVATAVRNFASYAAALAGYTAVIIAADTLGATGGASADVFMLAVWRASEICIGILCAGIVLAGTDLGSVRRRLTASFAELAVGIGGGFSHMLARAGREPVDTEPQRRELLRRIVALEPLIDQALGESIHLRHHPRTLQTAIQGLLRALDGWRGVATHLNRLSDDMDRQGLEAILCSIPPELGLGQESALPARWMADPMALRRICEEALQTLTALPTGTPSLRLLADETAKLIDGILNVLDGLALLVDAPGRLSLDHLSSRQSIADWRPALVNAARAFVMIGAVELFWVATAWPDGATTIVFSAVAVLLLSPKGDLAYEGAIAFALGIVGAVVCAAIIKFALLPHLDTFPAFCAAIGICLIPTGFARARSGRPAAIAIFTTMGVNFVPLLAPTNQMSYDTAQFYNTALAIVVGCGIAPLAFRLLPSLTPSLRARRLLDLTLRDLRRLAVEPLPPGLEDWEGRIYGRFVALPDQAEPLQRARLLAALSLGTSIIQLRRMAPQLGVATEFEGAFNAFARGNNAIAIARLRQLDQELASGANGGSTTAERIALRARAWILVLSEVLAEHSSYFVGGASA